ncbi:hypothetical protein PRVXT_000995 [Proteinivorax tanatarense]|uniref:ABC transporter permease n=1 Tax=Proteinivorax tanatarense TaxID=1260629 RepID=A0AAU7VNS1_9FIRM
MIVNEVRESLKRKKGFTFSIIFVVLVFALMASTLFITYVYMQERHASVQTYGDKNVYTLMDTLTGKEERQFFKDPESVSKLQHMYTYLNKQINETFISATDHPISIEFGDISDTDIFLQGYESGRPSEPVEKNGTKYNSVKAVKVNQQALETFPINNLTDGRLFDKADYENLDFGSIPVLLGAEYEDIFDIGDRIESTYLFYPFTLEVIGFIESNSFLSTRIEPETYVDRYIVLPAQKFGEPANEEQFNFLRRYYLHSINGAIYSSEDLAYIDGLIKQANDVTGFNNLMILGGMDSQLGAILETMGEQISALLFLTVTLFIICILMLVVLIWKKVQDNYKNIAIHLISGGTMNQIFSYIAGEILFIVSVPMIIVLFTVTLFVIGMQPIAILYGALITIIALFLMILSLFIIYIKGKRLSISTVLKRGD